MKLYKAFSIALLLTAPCQMAETAYAQNAAVIAVAPLFEYPSAPDEIEGISGKSAWLMQHFWDSFNFKDKNTVDQNALNHAFKVYATPMRWAPKEDVEASTERIIKQLDKNPTLLLQFTKAAEESLYGPKADVWIDEIYIRYLKAISRNKKISEVRKARYENQLKMLENSALGAVAPQFDFIDMFGNEAKYFPMSTFTIIEFGDSDCDDCRFAKLKMESNAALSSLVNQGKVNIMFIIPDADETWTTKIAGYPRKWTVGASDNVSDFYDLRTTPSFYLIDNDGKIMMKNVDVMTAISSTLDKFGKQ